MKSLIAAMLTGTVVLGAAVAYAHGEADINRNPPWQAYHSAFRIRHPMLVTCREFTRTGAVNRPYVVGYIEGRANDPGKMPADGTMAPLKTSAVKEQCENHPDMKVSQLVDTMLMAR